MARLPGHRLQRHVIEIAAVHQPLACCERRRLVVRLDGHGEQLAPVRHPPDGLQRDFDAPCPPGDGAEHLVARQPLQRGAGHRLELRRAGHGGHIALIGEHFQGTDRGHCVRRLDEGVAHGGERLDAGVVVRVAGLAGVLEKGNQGCQVRHPFDRRTTHPGIGVAPGDLQQHVARVLGESTHGADPDRRVVTLPSRLSTQSFEQLHDSDGWTDFR